MGGVKIYTVSFRTTIGQLTISAPEGGQLLRVHQMGSGRWVAHILAAEDAGVESRKLWMMTSHGENHVMDMGKATCVGYGTSTQGRTVYVFDPAPAVAKKKPGRPKKAATTPPVDEVAD
jgi:hypothetical protein